MIVPRNSLLFWFAGVALPFSAAGAILPGALPLSAVLITLLAILVLLDAILALGRLEGLTVALPDVLRVSKDRPAALDLTLNNHASRLSSVRVGLAFPDAVSSQVEEHVMDVPAAGESIRYEWPVLPCRRGRFHLRTAVLEGSSPLRFWALRRRQPVMVEFRVYPDLLTERRQLSGLFLNRGTFGIHAQRQIGKGREFEKLREYIPGDSMEDIHWKASAKRGYPVTKLYQIERTQEVYVLIDTSRLSARQTVAKPAGMGDDPLRPPESALERYLTAALMLGLAAEQQGDLFGLATFSDKVDTFVRAKNGSAHYDTCRDALYTMQSSEVTPDFEEMASFIRLRLRRRALLVFITALDDPIIAESFVKSIDMLCRQHLILANMIKPAVAAPLFSEPMSSGWTSCIRAWAVIATGANFRNWSGFCIDGA